MLLGISLLQLIIIENIKKAIGEKIYDVIGKRLVTEEEIINLYEELLRLPKEQWEAKVKRIDGIIEEKRRILSQINELLLGYRLDRSKLGDIKENVQNVINKDENNAFDSVSSLVNLIVSFPYAIIG